MTMKADFDNIISLYGHDIFLQRKTDSGYATTFEIHTVRYDSLQRQLPNAQTEQEEGRLHTTTRRYYFRSDSIPFEGDRIYESEPEEPTGQTVWFIDGTVPLRGENGSIAYYTAGATRLHPN